MLRRMLWGWVMELCLSKRARGLGEGTHLSLLSLKRCNHNLVRVTSGCGVNQANSVKHHDVDACYASEHQIEIQKQTNGESLGAITKKSRSSGRPAKLRKLYHGNIVLVVLNSSVPNEANKSPVCHRPDTSFL